MAVASVQGGCAGALAAFAAIAAIAVPGRVARAERPTTPVATESTPPDASESSRPSGTEAAAVAPAAYEDTETTPATADVAESSAATAPPWLTYRLHHLIKLDGVIWPQQLPGRASRRWAELEYRPRLLVEGGATLRVTAEPLLRAAQAWAGPLGSHPSAPFSERQTALIKEAQVKVVTPWMDIGAGWQIFSWGRADGIRPLEVLQIADYSDRLRDESLGVPSLSLTAGGEQWTVEAVGVPRRVLSRVSYDPANVWSVAAVAASGLPVEVDRAGERARAFEQWEGGIRVSYSGSAGEIAGIVFRGYDHVPTSLLAMPRTTADGEPVLVLTPTFGQLILVGLTAAVTGGSYLMRLDAALPFYDDTSLPFRETSLHAVAGIERRYTVGNGAGSVLVMLQYIYDQRAPKTTALVRQHAPPPFRFLRHAVSASVSISTQSSLSAELKGLADLISGGWIARASASYKLREGVSIWAGVDGIAGPPEAAIGQLAKADRFLLGVDFVAQ